MKSVETYLGFRQRLDALMIPYRIMSHRPVFTMHDRNIIHGVTVVKNILLKNNRTDSYILMLLGATTKINFKTLAAELETSRSSLRFATDEELNQELNVSSGFVSPLIIPNQTSNLRLMIDPQLIDCDNLGFHAGKNTETLVISYADLIKLISYLKLQINSL